MGGYPDSNREHTVPHTGALPLNYIHLCKINIYLGMVRTFNSKYQKFMTYRLVHEILYAFDSINIPLQLYIKYDILISI